MTSVTVSFGYSAAVWRLTPIRGLSASASRRDVQAQDRGRAAVRIAQALEDLDGRRLAGAVGPEQAEDLAARDLEIDAVHRDAGRRSA